MGSGGQIKVGACWRAQALCCSPCRAPILNGLLSSSCQTGAWDPEEDDLLYYWQVILKGFAGQEQQRAA
jgi:hypothetical protein